MMEEGRKKASRYVRALGPVGLIGLVLALGGCGSSSPITAAIDLSSPAVKGGVTHPNVRCGWGSIWLPLKWGAVPEGTKEVAIFIGRYKYVDEGGRRKLVVPFADLLSRMKPSLRGLAANVLPDGTSWSRVGPVSCPVKAEGQRVLVGVFALDHARTSRPLKMPLAVRLTEEALEHGKPGEHPRSPGTLTEEATGTGWLDATYTGPHF